MSSYKMTQGQIQHCIESSKTHLRNSLDELEYLVDNTRDWRVKKYITEHYKDLDTIAYQCYHNNKLEGLGVTLTDTGSIIRGNTAKVSSKYREDDINDVKGFVAAYKKSVMCCKRSSITIPLIKELHRNLMMYTEPEIGGVYRSGNATILGHEDYIKFVHPSNIDKHLSKIIEDYNISVNSGARLFSACEFKTRFISIHPFADGNGRTSRIILNCMLISEGFIPIVIRDGEKLGYRRAMQVGYQALHEGIPGGHLPLVSIVVNDLIKGYKGINSKSFK